MPLTGLTVDEFAGLMAPLGPFGPGRRVVVGVSGGADSMALALLLRGWGKPEALVVDHGLRAGSAGEAAGACGELARVGVPAAVVRLGLGAGPDLGARARAARYAALFARCRAVGVPDLVVGHHARDQDETVLLRARSGSGAAGLAGMARVAWHGDARLLRPLLGVDPVRLRDTLRAADVRWCEDPGNTDPATARGALRQGPIPPAPLLGSARRELEAAVAAELAGCVAFHPSGHADVTGALSAAAWSALVWCVSGRAYPPGRAAVARFARDGGTLHGVLRRGGTVCREPAALAAPVPAVAGAVWDGRFRLCTALDGAWLGALGAEAARFCRGCSWPATVLRGLPALRRGGKLLAVPHLGFAADASCHTVRLDFRPARPLAGAPFAP